MTQESGKTKVLCADGRAERGHPQRKNQGR